MSLHQRPAVDKAEAGRLGGLATLLHHGIRHFRGIGTLANTLVSVHPQLPSTLPRNEVASCDIGVPEVSTKSFQPVPAQIWLKLRY